ncbi:MAG: sulfite exporter TauE/SafE family protein, partial [Acidimicrobiales bacterium]|nr:sulfite exporter TauE/SafE family protein [Acidimicrobiales bacterium]
MSSTLLVIVLIGAAVGFLGGLLGKGGSAIATPVLLSVGVPPAVALAAPLPATVPGALVAADRYRRDGQIDRRVLRWSLIAGIPATIIGAVATRWIDASALVTVTEVIIIGLGVRLLTVAADEVEGEAGQADRNRTIAVAVVTGLAAGLLANSG